MRYYVNCHNCGQRIYFDSNARLRSELPNEFGFQCPYCGVPSSYSNREVIAEPGQLQTGGAILGGLLGLAVSGGAGAILGAILGGLLGKSREESEVAAVEEFNRS